MLPTALEATVLKETKTATKTNESCRSPMVKKSVEIAITATVTLVRSFGFRHKKSKKKNANRNKKSEQKSANTTSNTIISLWMDAQNKN